MKHWSVPVVMFPRRCFSILSQRSEAINMRNIDDILAAAQKKAMVASLHEAFEAGKAHTATELKARMVAFFEGLVLEPKRMPHRLRPQAQTLRLAKNNTITTDGIIGERASNRPICAHAARTQQSKNCADW
jgi:hypothetical protein